MFTIGIVGAGANKFSQRGTEIAKNLITAIIVKGILDHPDIVIVSGHSPMGGVDIWTEEIAKEVGVPMQIFAPRQQSWEGEYGYKARNLDIAKSDEVHVIVVDEYPSNYRGRKFSRCYHCSETTHVKSGGCWTGRQAFLKGAHVLRHVVRNGGGRKGGE